MESPGRQATLSYRSFAAKIGIGFHYFIPISQTDEKVKGAVVGLRIGYVLTTNDPDWSVGDVKVKANPDGGFGGPYVRLVLGGGER
jgi:hypothetical protein